MRYLFICLFCICVSRNYAQQSVHSAGGNGSGAGGTVSFSIGQPGYSFYTSNSGLVTLGVQQSQLSTDTSNTACIVKIQQPDTSICLGASITLNANVPDFTFPGSLKDGLVAMYPLDGNGRDFSGNELHGIVNGALATRNRFGVMGYAMSFNDNQDIIIPNTEGKNTYPLTISAWFKANPDLVTGNIFGKYSPAIWNGYQMFATNYTDNGDSVRVIPWYIRDPSNRVLGQYGEERFDGVVSFNKWVHGVFVLDETGGRFYIDGNLVGTHPWTGNPGASSNSLAWKIGGWYDQWFKGEIDDIYVYNRAVSLSEIQQLNKLSSTPGSSSSVTYKWSTGDTTASISVKPLTTTTYYLTVSNGVTTCMDSVTVTVKDAPGFNPLPSNIYSKSESVTLNAGPGFTSYQWNTGATTSSIDVKYTGSYRVIVNNDGCTLTDTTFVQFADTVGIFVPVILAECSTLVDIPVKAYNFRNIASMQGSVRVPLLQFESISSFGPGALGLQQSNFGLTQIASGTVSFSWNDPRLTGVTLPDSTTLFTMRFRVPDNFIGAIDISLPETPVKYEFVDPQLKERSVDLRPSHLISKCGAVVTGRVITPLEQGVLNVEMKMTGQTPVTTYTDRDGNYSITVSPGSYRLTPYKNNDKNKTNGVTTMDISLIQAHILLQPLLNSPYKIIAADANNSGTVTTADILYVRRLILGIDTTFPGNRTWAFVTNEYVFPDPLNPFPYPSTKDFANLTGRVTQSFKGIKIGDVNYDRNPQVERATQLSTVGIDTVRMYYETSTDNGEYVVKVRSKGIQNLMGMQYTMSWDPSQMKYLGMGNNPIGIFAGERWTSEGKLGMSWNDPVAKGQNFKQGDLMFELRYKTSGSIDASSLRIGSERVPEEAFDFRYREMALKLESPPQPGLSGVFVVYPNPASQYINIRFDSEETGLAEFRLLDITGKEVLHRSMTVNKGENNYKLNLIGKSISKGTYVLQVKNGNQLRSVRVILSNN